MYEDPGAYINLRASAIPTMTSDANEKFAASAQTGGEIISLLVKEAQTGDIVEDVLEFSEPKVSY